VWGGEGRCEKDRAAAERLPNCLVCNLAVIVCMRWREGVDIPSWEGSTRVGPCANTRITVRVQLWSLDLTDSIGLLLSITVGPILPGEGTGAATAGWRSTAAGLLLLCVPVQRLSQSSGTLT